jgi:hypothetical protein
MTNKTLVLTISVMFVVGMMPLYAFAAQPETPNGQPFNELDDKIAQLEAELAQMRSDLDDKDAQLQTAIDALDAKTAAKDAQLDSKDNALMTKDTELMETDNVIKHRVNANSRLAGAVCDNVPFMRDGMGFISQTSSATIDAIEDAADLEIKFTVPITNPSFSIPNPELHTETITVATIDFKIPTSFHVHASTKTFNIPDPTIDLGKPISFIVAPLLASNLLPAADAAITSVTDCDPDSLNDIDVPL